MNRQRESHNQVWGIPRRQGSVLIVVLVLIMMLTLGVYGFTERMLIENKAAVSHSQSAQAIASAESGVQYAAALINTRYADPENPTPLYHQPELYAGQIVAPSTSPSAVGRFSIVAPLEGDATASQLRFGLSDESGRLNINAIVSLDLTEDEQALMLMNLPFMTEDIADAILDYVDDDDTTRLLGAEFDYYQTLPLPYLPKNGPLETIDELLMVRGVTPELLYGEDANRNGLLDPMENDGPASNPVDNADGILQLGWDRFLTIRSKESNLRTDGTAKIFVNQSMLTDLFDEIVEITNDEEMARFIVAYRMYGPNDGEVTNSSSNGSNNSNSGEDDSDGTDSQQDSDQTDVQAASAAMDDLAGNLADAIAGSAGDQTTTRGGLDLSTGAQYEITSLYDLVDRTVDVPENSETNTQAESIDSPWSSANILNDFPTIHDLLSTTESSSIEGRINVNEARLEVLMALPGMDEQTATNIVSGQMGVSGANSAGDVSRSTSAWLVAQNILDLPRMRQLDRFLTGQGDVFRVQSVGFQDGGGPQARIEAIIDGSVVPAKVVVVRDLSTLGVSYTTQSLLPTQ